MPGIAGPRGLSAWENVPAGVTLTGRARAYNSFSGTTQIFSRDISLPATAPAIINDSDIVVKQDATFAAVCPDPELCMEPVALTASNAKTDICDGTYEDPAAPYGIVCVYFGSSTSNVQNLTFYGGSRTSFLAAWRADGLVDQGMTDFDISWAYTAPAVSGQYSLEAAGSAKRGP